MKVYKKEVEICNECFNLEEEEHYTDDWQLLYIGSTFRCKGKIIKETIQLPSQKGAWRCEIPDWCPLDDK